MSKEADLKKIELKVSVNCCDGCKKEVKKVLQSVEGVLKTEIDPSQPKVTVLGNVDPQILIKKLSRVGKQAELLSNGNHKEGKEKNDAEMPVTKSKSLSDQEKCFDSCAKTIDRSKESEKHVEAHRDKASKKDQKEKDSTPNSSIQQVIKKEDPLTPFPDTNSATYSVSNTMHNTGNEGTYAQYYVVEPYTIAGPYYAAIPSSKAPPLPPPCHGLQEYYHCIRPVSQPPFQRPSTQVGDYFSDENTVGCFIM